MKASIRYLLTEGERERADIYKDTGVWQKIARSSCFEHGTLILIILNAIWIALDTDLNDQDVLADSAFVFQLMENLFCSLFAGEWVVRFMSFKRKKSALRDWAFIFDSFLLACMVLEVWVMMAAMSIFDSSREEIFEA